MRIVGSKVRKYRTAAGLSARALGRAVGLRAPAIARLEEAGDADRLTLGAFSRVYDALGVAPAELLPDATKERQPTDATPLVGELLRALVVRDGQVEERALVEHLQVSAGLVLSAMADLRQLLHPNGLFVTFSEGTITLGARSGVGSVPDETERRARNRRRVDARTAGFVLQAMNGSDLHFDALAGDSYIRIKQFRNAGIVQELDGRVHATDDVAFSLLEEFLQAPRDDLS